MVTYSGEAKGTGLVSVRTAPGWLCGSGQVEQRGGFIRHSCWAKSALHLSGKKASDLYTLSGAHTLILAMHGTLTVSLPWNPLQ